MDGREQVEALYRHWTETDRCRLIGEDVWEFDDSQRAYIKLAPADVLTAEQAGKLLEPLIKPLPPFDDSLLPGLNEVTAA
ncbi:MAG: hypothetical protein ACR2MK_10225 [Solirubrobacteraceae bacterium]